MICWLKNSDSWEFVFRQLIQSVPDLNSAVRHAKKAGGTFDEQKRVMLDYMSSGRAFYRHLVAFEKYRFEAAKK